jgi:hypothetical protein
VKGKQKAVTDGPFAEAKDVVGGFTLIEARDLEQAVELSKGCPIFEVEGAVEVRPVMDRFDGGRPNKGSRILIPGLQEFFDRGDHVGHAEERAATDAFAGQLSRPALH